MKLWMIAALGGALLAGCAPFEHGHYGSDVSYINSGGDPAGTPVVFHGEPSRKTGYGAPVQQVAYMPQPAPVAYEPATQSTYGYSQATTLGTRWHPSGVQIDADGYAVCTWNGRRY